jgi:hypothetical protein
MIMHGHGSKHVRMEEDVAIEYFETFEAAIMILEDLDEIFKIMLHNLFHSLIWFCVIFLQQLSQPLFRVRS